MGVCYSCLRRKSAQKQERLASEEENKLLSATNERQVRLDEVPVGENDEIGYTDTDRHSHDSNPITESDETAINTHHVLVTDTVDAGDQHSVQTDWQGTSSILVEVKDDRRPDDSCSAADDSCSAANDSCSAVLRAVDETTDFPFFTDVKTVDYVRHSKTIFLMRGLSGSGKSFLVDLLRRVYPEAVVCSADDYFRREGHYEFATEHLPYAHDECKKNAKTACEAGTNVVVIDNTNVKRWEMKHYFDLAWLNYTVVIVEPRTAWSKDPVELARKTQHGIGEDLARKKLKDYENITPLFYAWFLNEHDSKFLLAARDRYWRECVESLPQLMQVLQGYLQASDRCDVTADKIANYYQLRSTSNPSRMTSDNSFQIEHVILHCTAKYCGSKRNPVSDAEHYSHRSDVRHTLGKVFDLKITGVTFTPRTIAARLQLSQEQLNLFNKPEEIQRDKQILARMAPGLANTGRYPEKGRCAHITLGCAPGVAPYQTNMDVLDICDLEYQASKGEISVTEVLVTDGTLRYYKDGMAALQFENPLTFETMFSGHY